MIKLFVFFSNGVYKHPQFAQVGWDGWSRVPLRVNHMGLHRNGIGWDSHCWGDPLHIDFLLQCNVLLHWYAKQKSFGQLRLVLWLWKCRPFFKPASRLVFWPIFSGKLLVNQQLKTVTYGLITSSWWPLLGGGCPQKKLNFNSNASPKLEKSIN